MSLFTPSLTALALVGPCGFALIFSLNAAKQQALAGAIRDSQPSPFLVLPSGLSPCLVLPPRSLLLAVCLSRATKHAGVSVLSALAEPDSASPNRISRGRRRSKPFALPSFVGACRPHAWENGNPSAECAIAVVEWYVYTQAAWTMVPSGGGWALFRALELAAPMDCQRVRL